jgi:phosphatidylglycerol---prolipoprotein diacylglyceryl transferase
MLHFPQIDPVVFSVGFLEVRWYGICYFLGFLGAYALCIRRRDIPRLAFEKITVADLLIYVALGVIFGGSLGYWLLYRPTVLWESPWQLLAFWEPGRSFHGGLIGVLIAVALFCRKTHYRFLEVTDFIAPAVPIGLGFGRLGNFINGELWGRTTTVPWGMIFPQGGAIARHPSQLYECFLEGLVLSLALIFYAGKRRPVGSVSGWFLVGYAVFRTLAEFFREPDWHQGFIAFDWLTMGQCLSVPMLLLGVVLIQRAQYGSRAPCASISI